MSWKLKFVRQLRTEWPQSDYKIVILCHQECSIKGCIFDGFFMKKKISGKFYFCIFIGGILLLFAGSCKQKTESAGDTPAVIYDSTTSDETLQQLNDRIMKNPKDASAYFARGQVFSAKNILQQAFVDVSKATIIDSTRPEYFLLLADICFRGLQIQKAVQAFEKCLQLEPENIEANLKLSELYMYIKVYPKAIDYANTVLRINKNNQKAYFIKGFVYKESGDTSRAISSFTTVVELDPENYDAYIQLGILHAAKGNDLAIQYYSNALRIRPSSEEALYNRGLYYQESGLLEKAEEDYKLILSKNSAYTNAYYNLGFIALVNKKDYPEAIKQFSKAIEIDQNYVEAFYNRGVAYQYSGNKKSAEKDFRSALSIFPNYSLAKDRLNELN